MSQQLQIALLISYHLLLSPSAQENASTIICDSYETCTITCGNGEGGELPCNAVVFDATMGPYFNLICPKSYSCQNIQVNCPLKYVDEQDDGHCNITCHENNSCQYMTIHSNLNQNLNTQLNCYGDDNYSNICDSITIDIQDGDNDTNFKNNHILTESTYSSSISVNCINNGPYDPEIKQICSSIKIIEDSSTESSYSSSLVALHCDHNTECIDISINTPNIHLLNISITDNSLFTRSTINGLNNINLYLLHSNLSGSSLMNTSPTSERDNVSVIIIANSYSNISSSKFLISNVDKVIFSSDIYDNQISQLFNTSIQVTTDKADVNQFEIINLNTIYNNDKTVEAQYVNTFNVECSHKDCGQIYGINLRNATSALFNMRQGAKLWSNIDSESIESIRINIDDNSYLVDSEINAKYASKEVILTMYGQMSESQNTIRANDAIVFRLYCLNENSCGGGAGSLILYPPSTTTEKYSYIECKGKACQKLALHTTNPPSQDIIFNMTDCPCSDDITNGCIDEWELFCGNNQKGTLSDAKTCKQDTKGVPNCCEGLIDDLHEKYICPWPSNTTYTCIENEPCEISCDHIVQQTNQSDFKCSTDKAIIDGSKATSLIVHCEEGDSSCNNGLTVYCPESDKDGNCQIDCNHDQSCKGTKINTQKNEHLLLNCNAENSCYQTS